MARDHLDGPWMARMASGDQLGADAFPWASLKHQHTAALTPLFPPPSQMVQDLIDNVREPEGVGPALDIESAPGH